MADKKVRLVQNHKFTTTAGNQPELEKILKPNIVDLPGMKGTLPFIQNKPINQTGKLSQEAVKEIERLNSLPEELPEEVKRKVFKPDIKDAVDIDALPEEKRKEVLKNIKNMMDRTSTQEDAFVPSSPDIAEAYAQARRAAALTEENIKQSKQTNTDKQKTEKEPGIEAKQEKKTEPDTPPIQAEPLVCVHCNWPVGSKEGCAPTKVDKQIFVIAVLGQKRFVKEYELLGKQLHVSFRSLTVEENDLVIKQLMKDWNDGKISGPAHSVAEAVKYQMVLSLAAIETNVGVIQLPTLDEYDYIEPEVGTILPEITNYVNKNAMSNEPLRRIVSKAYGHFIETQSKLEAMAESPDFWQATED